MVGRVKDLANGKTSRLLARPPLKWVGGKRQLLLELLAHLPPTFKNYHEPFLGGGALFFELANQGKIEKAFLSDMNEHLIITYTAIRDQLPQVLRLLKHYLYAEKFYYAKRALDPTLLSLPERAARFIYLNKTCYNGLYRENKKGLFNVPFGRYTNPSFCDPQNMQQVSQALSTANILQHSFEKILVQAKKGDLIYFDPPYHPVSKTASFTAYQKSGFKEAEQIKLRDIILELDKKGCFIMLSNSAADLILELYAKKNTRKNFHVDFVKANRSINSKSSARGKVSEIILTNYVTNTELKKPHVK